MNLKKGETATMEMKDSYVRKTKDWVEKGRKKRKIERNSRSQCWDTDIYRGEKAKEIVAIFARQSFNIVINRLSSENPIQ